MEHDVSEYIALWAALTVMVVIAIVGGSQWLREYREREIYRRTRQPKS
jgi:hypothetical protein